MHNPVMEIYGIVLAGGGGTRLGGVDKSRLRLGSDTLLQHVLRRLESQCHQSALIGQPTRGGASPVPIVADQFDPPIGPLGGIYTGALWAKSQVDQLDQVWILTAPVDGPLFPSDFVQRASSAMNRGTPIVGRYRQDLYPVCGLWPLASALTIPDLLNTQTGNAIRPILNGLDAQEIDFQQYYSENPFANANRLTDLLRLQERFAHRNAEE